MSIDKQKLKALAEAATPGRVHDRLDSAGGGLKYTCTGNDGSLVLQVDHKNNEFGFIGDRAEADEAFFLECTPAAVLALLDEVERLREERDSQQRVCIAEMEKGVQLKAENEALRNSQGADMFLTLTGEIVRFRKALSDLAALYESDEGCRGLPEYVAALAALADGEQP